MSKEKAELVDRLNAIQRRISEQGLWADPKLLEAKKEIEAQLNLISNKEKDGRD
jgi:hypothetical protein